MGCAKSKEGSQQQQQESQRSYYQNKQEVGATFSVIIRLEHGSTLTVNASDKMTIQQLKQEIHAKNKMPIDKQKLLYDNQTLENQQTVSQYSIKKDAELRLIEVEDQPMHLGNKNFVLDPQDQDEIEITVCDVNNSVSNFKISKVAKIHDLKKLIFEKTGTQIQQQQFFFQGALLEDGKTIQDQNIQNLSKIELNFINQGGNFQQIQWDISYVIKK